MKKLFLIFSLLLTVFSCGKNDNTQESSQNTEFDIIYNGALYGNGSEGITQSNLVIKNETEWKQLMSKMNNSRNNITDNFSETEIDFKNYMVIAVFLGIKRSGWEVKINNVLETKNNLVVSTDEKQLLSSVITQPFSIIKIRRTEKAVVLK